MLAHIFAYFGPFDTRSHKVANLAYCTKCSIFCYKEQRIRIIITDISSYFEHISSIFFCFCVISKHILKQVANMRKS